MAQQVAGFPFWEVRFDEQGRPVDSSAIDEFVSGVASEGLTDLWLISHGWNSSPETSRRLYARFLAEIRSVLDSGGASLNEGVRLGAAGIIWPAMRWADEEPGAGAGGPASGAGGARPDAEMVLDLKAVYAEPAQQAALDGLSQLLKDRPRDPKALARFQELMRELTSDPDAADTPEDSGERHMLEEDPREVFERFADEDSDESDDQGGPAGLRDAWGKVWEGAKTALRQATYWQMKKRAGVVGKEGLAPIVGRLVTSRPGLRVHLVGHSFGARLMSFVLPGVRGEGAASPVKSLFLLQGAFSHWAFASSLPFDRSRGGALAGMASRVDGPLLVSHTVHDSAVRTFYPLTSMTTNDYTAAGGGERISKWGAMGHDGAQAVGAAELRFLPVGRGYSFEAGKFVNLDGNNLIKEGGPPAGAHTDIFHPEIAWAALSAAGVLKAS